VDGGWLGDFVHDPFHGYFWGLIIGGIVFLVRITSPSSGREPSQSALEILKQRYAKGEIGKEEFEAKRRELLS